MAKPLNHLAWMKNSKGRVLHCVPDAVDERGSWYESIVNEGGVDSRAVCGRGDRFFTIGIFSRMGADRCKKCCELLRIPEGKGTPLNEGVQMKNGV